MVQTESETRPVKNNWIGKLWLWGAGLLLLFNLAYLDFQIWKLNQMPQFSSDVTVSTKNNVTEEPQISPRQDLDYVQVANMIQEATASLTQKVDSLSQIPASAPQTSAPETTQVQEFYIPLGSGATASQDWIDLAGVEAYVAPANFGKVKEMYFEAALRIPTGNGRVYARLKNVTDGVGLIESEVSHEGAAGALKSSGKIPVPTATKLYRVQLKSSLGVTVSLDNARIKIFVE